MTRHAIIDPKTNKVINVIIWEGAEWKPPIDTIVMKSDIADIGDDYDPIKKQIIKVQKIS